MNRMGVAEGWIARVEALERLGVKTQTLYAYVSRGRIAARPDPADPRRSLYALTDVERLTGHAPDSTDEASFSRVGGAPVRGEALIHSSLGVIAGGRLFYRGMDAAQLSESSTLEDGCRLMWDARDQNPFAGLGPRIGLGGVTARIRLVSALARRAEEDPSSAGRDGPALRAEAAAVLNEAVDAVAGPGPRLHFHQRLGRGWKVIEKDNPLIRRALVLSMDLDVDAAVIATRVAVDGGASPAAAALAGLGVVLGSPFATRLETAAAYVHEARRDPAGSAARALERHGSVPGFGDPQWPDGDPRASALLAAADLHRDLISVVAEGEAASGRAAAFEIALALAARRLDLPRDGALAVLLIGRLAGLLAHALDQRADGSPIQARLRYVGPRPGAN